MTRLPAYTRFALVALLLAGLGGCQTIGGWFGKDKAEPTETLPVEEMYSVGHGSMLGGNYERGERYFQRLVARFPYGPYSEQGQLELAYSQFKQEKHEDATSTIERFIRTYPTHRNIDYAYYLKALVNFDRGDGILLRLARMDTSARDLGAPTQSFNDFAEVLRRYPNSPYAQDSRQRMVFLRNLLARHELNVGLYYLRRGAYVSALNRGQYILETYPQSEHQGDAVALLARSYTLLGQEQLAADARKVLEQNYPQHAYLSGDWPDQRSIFRQLNPFAGGQ